MLQKTTLNPLRNRGFRLLLAGQGLSQLGDWLYNVALLAFVFDRTHSVAWLGATTAARVLPIVLLGPVAGMLGDRFDRRLILVAADLFRAVVMVGLVVVVAADLPVVLAPVLAAAATAASSPYPSCVAATMPRLLDREQLTRANALRSSVGSVAVVLGPAVGAGVLAAGGVRWAFAANAATFVAAAILTLAVRESAIFRPSRSAVRAPGLLAAVTAGARELLRHGEAARLVGADMLCSLVYGVETVVLVTVATRLGWSTSGYGVLLAALGVGGLLGATLTPRAVLRIGRRGVQLVALLAVALSLPLLVMVPSAATVLVLVVLNGAGSLAVEVCTETALAEQLSDDVFARAYGFAFPASIAGIALGSVLAAPLIGALGLVPGLLLIAAFVGAYAAVAARASN